MKGLKKEEIETHFKGIGARLPTAAIKEKSFAGMFALMIADGSFDKGEEATLGAFASFLGINESKGIEIVNTVVAAIKKATAK